MYTISTLISEEKLVARIKEMGAQISRDYEGKSVHLICIPVSYTHLDVYKRQIIHLPSTTRFVPSVQIRQVRLLRSTMITALLL